MSSYRDLAPIGDKYCLDVLHVVIWMTVRKSERVKEGTRSRELSVALSAGTDRHPIGVITWIIWFHVISTTPPRPPRSSIQTPSNTPTQANVPKTLVPCTNILSQCSFDPG
jgi:hypothetical protein